jgi:hypothetical protein
MSARRQPPPPKPIPERESGGSPAVSGEYRIGRTTTTTTTSLPAVRVAAQPHPVTGATHRGPPRSTKPRADAAGPPLSSGRELHDLDFDFEPAIRAGDAPELDGRPSSHRTRVEMPRPSTLDGASPGRATPASMPRTTPAAMPVIDAHASLVAFSGFGNPPSSLFGTPMYAARVIRRRRVLRRDLELARLRHSHDVGFYEAALRTADDEAVRKGILLSAVFFTMVTALLSTVVHVASGVLVLPW